MYKWHSLLPVDGDAAYSGGAVKLFPMGKWSHPIFGDEEMTSTKADALISNFDSRIAKESVPLIVGHDRGPALGWISGLEKREDGVWGEIELNDDGRDTVTKDRYRFVSPGVTWDWKRPSDGKKFGPVLSEVSLTNFPFFGFKQTRHELKANDGTHAVTGVYDSADECKYAFWQYDDGAMLAQQTETPGALEPQSPVLVTNEPQGVTNIPSATGGANMSDEQVGVNVQDFEAAKTEYAEKLEAAEARAEKQEAVITGLLRQSRQHTLEAEMSSMTFGDDNRKLSEPQARAWAEFMAGLPGDDEREALKRLVSSIEFMSASVTEANPVLTADDGGDVSRFNTLVTSFLEEGKDGASAFEAAAQKDPEAYAAWEKGSYQKTY